MLQPNEFSLIQCLLAYSLQNKKCFPELTLCFQTYLLYRYLFLLAKKGGWRVGGRAQEHVTPRSLSAREKLLSLLFNVTLFLFCQLIFACDMFLYAPNLFVKKEINRHEIVQIALIYNTTIFESIQGNTRMKLPCI